MRSLKFVAMVTMCSLVLACLAYASENKFGIAESRNIQITAPTLVGGVLLPAGDYKVLHTMEGQDHIMVFTQLHTKKPAAVRVKCQLVPLAKRAEQDEQVIGINAANDRELRSLVFRGDLAQHVF